VRFPSARKVLASRGATPVVRHVRQVAAEPPPIGGLKVCFRQLQTCRGARAGRQWARSGSADRFAGHPRTRPVYPNERKWPAVGRNVSYGPRLCENSARYNRTRNFEACGHAQSKKTQKFILQTRPPALQKRAARPRPQGQTHSPDCDRLCTKQHEG
jgi:hypothetical protein